MKKTTTKPIENSRRGCWSALPMWVVFLGLALFSLAGWVRMFYAIVAWYWLGVVAEVWPGPFYLVLTGALWGIAGLVAVIWLWLRRPLARLAAFGVGLFLAITYWLDRLLTLHLNSYGNNLVFAALVTLLGLIYAFLVLRPWEDLRARDLRRENTPAGGSADR